MNIYCDALALRNGETLGHVPSGYAPALTA